MTNKTNKTNEISLNSPKNKFRVEVHYNKPLVGVGSVVSFGRMSLEGVEDYVRRYWMNGQTHAYIVIRENLKTFPEFNWKTLREEHINA